MEAMTQTTRPMLILAGLTALMLALAPLGRAQMEEESTDAYAEANDAGAMPSGGMPAMGRGDRGGMMAQMSSENLQQRLGLTDDQAAKLKALRGNYLKETTMQGARIRVAELELGDLLDEKKLDASKIEKKVKEIESLKSELLMGRIRSLIKSADFLSPEQFAQLRAMTMHRMGAMRPMGRMQKHPMNPHGGSGRMPGQMPGQMPGMMNPHQ
jgi:Spy/CpxP family protein refolding chaperone